MSKWPAVPLGKVIRQRKSFVVIDDFTEYKRCRVQLHAQGIVLRDTVPGTEIKTKKQQACKAGDFLVAEIDAKVGGFGIVPDDLDGAIVSSHYFLFEVADDQLDRQFLDYFIRTPNFRDQVTAQGSTNYAAIRPNDVLGYQIPLPLLPEQRRIVARIEELAAKINEARELRQKAVEEAEAFVTSFHAKLAGTRMKKLHDIFRLDEDLAAVTPTGSYPQVGVKSFGAGLFAKSAVGGSETTYKTFNRLYEGALVLSQVKGWEGAVAICPPELDGWFVSPEYRTFRCVKDQARPKYLAPVVCTKWFWEKLGRATRGVGARRERTRPEQFLNIEIPIPTIEKQAQGERVFAQVAALKKVQAETAAELHALLPSILDKAFKEEL
jgi:type I restriction enzyme, S subunit